MDGFAIGPLKIYSYSLCLLAAVWVGYALALRQAKTAGISTPKLTDIVALLLVTGVIGARLGYVIQNFSYFNNHPAQILTLNSGGLSIHGAFWLGMVALYYYAKQRKLPLIKLTDLLALPVLAGQIIGRLGNYFNQELFGYPTQVPWKIFIDPSHRPSQYLQSQYFHPTFLYEMILDAIGLAILWYWPNKKTGQLTVGYLLVFGIGRFIAEIWRISDRVIWGLSLAQLISVLMVIVALVLLKRGGKYTEETSESPGRSSK